MGNEKRYAELTYEQVVRKYADTVTRACLIRCGNIEDTRDCFQNVFMKLFTSDKTFESEEHLKAWLIRVAINQTIDMSRQFWKQKVSTTGEDSELDLVAVNVTDEEDATVLGYVMSLPVKYRQVLYMYYYEEIPVTQMANILQINESTIKSQLSRGRELIKKKLGGVGIERAQ